MTDSAKKAEKFSPIPGTFTTQNLREIVFEHVLLNLKTYQPTEDIDGITHMLSVMDLVEDLCLNVAKLAMVNRTQLSPLPSNLGLINPDPMSDPDDTQEYELRYRVVEQVTGQAPHRDEVFTFEEATEKYGESFVDTYWGSLGERCPHSLKLQGNKEIWFTVSRHPVQQLDQKMDQQQGSVPTRSPKMS